MGRRRSGLSLLGLALAGVVACAVFSATASAAPPKITSGSVTGSPGPLIGVCPFPLTSFPTFTFVEHDYFDNDGNATRTSFFLHEQDTFIGPTGVTLVSDPFDFSFQFTFNADGAPPTVFINGVIERVHLPDGSLFISAGRIDFSADGFPDFVIAPDQGGIHNLDGFCAALAG
jgi:hypothetical protein